ncbi:MAG: hypothetical protein EOO50_08150 [Flavobacterium sp.]|uniref:bestrophin family protein n=1 Tax=Flavobacterium sp. TaxID=239 RepID=UPI0011FFB7DC|nr:bestrophin family ion channel [Flavobacterium sp.]RZJ66849.1 MAG: hypothetical protein EOO50_08150 [Flavobacterium sp.]
MLLRRRISIFYFIKQVKWQLIVIVLFASAVGFLHLHPKLVNIVIPLSVLTIMGTIVSLLLAFRTAQSYERWWEARIIWGAIVNDSRTLIRDFSQFLPDDKKDELKILAERHIIWTYAMGESLRKLPFSPEVQAYIDTTDIDAVNIPNALLDAHSEQIQKLVGQGTISEYRQVRINETLGSLCDSMGKCERIKNTVFPRSYGIMLQTLIYTFAALLPFGLDHDKLSVEILLSILLPVMFISIEKTAVIMQDPFENTPVDTPMTSIAQTIEINIRQTIGDKNVPMKVDSGLYYEM